MSYGCFEIILAQRGCVRLLVWRVVIRGITIAIRELRIEQVVIHGRFSRVWQIGGRVGFLTW